MPGPVEPHCGAGDVLGGGSEAEGHQLGHHSADVGPVPAGLQPGEDSPDGPAGPDPAGPWARSLPEAAAGGPLHVLPPPPLRQSPESSSSNGVRLTPESSSGSGAEPVSRRGRCVVGGTAATGDGRRHSDIADDNVDDDDDDEDEDGIELSDLVATTTRRNDTARSLLLPHGRGRGARSDERGRGRGGVGLSPQGPLESSAAAGEGLLDDEANYRGGGDLEHGHHRPSRRLGGRRGRSISISTSISISSGSISGASTASSSSTSSSSTRRNRNRKRNRAQGTPGRRAASTSTAASFQRYTADEESAVVGKFDRRLVLFVALLYLLSFLDRSNIGNARVAGMDADLLPASSDEDYDYWYDWALIAFYVTYIGFEWMSLLWRVVPAHIYVSALVMSWGVAASLQAVAPSYPVLIVLRGLLGVGEAGFTGIPFYLSFFYRRHELAFRTAIFVSAAPLATSFASSLAWVVLKLGERGPIAPWRLLFLLEGFPSVAASLVAWRVIPDSPQTASYLTSRERRVARLRLRHERPPSSETSGDRDEKQQQKGVPKAATAGKEGKGKADGLKAREVLAAFVDPVALLTAAMLFLTNMAYSSLPVFLPTILEESMGHDRLRAQLLSAPPYLASFALVLATASLSDTLRSRSAFIVVHALLSALGYGLLALSQGALGLDAASPLRYLAVYPAAVGFFNVVVLTLAWTINNQPTVSRQGGGFALVQAVGQCGPLVGARLYPRAEAPFYTFGMAVCAVAMFAVAALALLLRWILTRRNCALDRKYNDEEQEGLVAASSSASSRRGQCPSMGGFRYML